MKISCINIRIETKRVQTWKEVSTFCNVVPGLEMYWGPLFSFIVEYIIGWCVWLRCGHNKTVSSSFKTFDLNGINTFACNFSVLVWCGNKNRSLHTIILTQLYGHHAHVDVVKSTPPPPQPHLISARWLDRWPHESQLPGMIVGECTT